MEQQEEMTSNTELITLLFKELKHQTGYLGSEGLSLLRMVVLFYTEVRAKILVSAHLESSSE